MSENSTANLLNVPTWPRTPGEMEPGDENDVSWAERAVQWMEEVTEILDGVLSGDMAVAGLPVFTQYAIPFGGAAGSLTEDLAGLSFNPATNLLTVGGNLIVGSDIGIVAQPNLVQLAANALRVNGDVSLNTPGFTGLTIRRDAGSVGGASLKLINDDAAGSWEVAIGNDEAFYLFNSDPAVRFSVQQDGDAMIAGDLIVDGGDIGITADPDLIQFAADEVTVNGDVILTSMASGGAAVVGTYGWAHDGAYCAYLSRAGQDTWRLVLTISGKDGLKFQNVTDGNADVLALFDSGDVSVANNLFVGGYEKLTPGAHTVATNGESAMFAGRMAYEWYIGSTRHMGGAMIRKLVGDSRITGGPVAETTLKTSTWSANLDVVGRTMVFDIRGFGHSAHSGAGGNRILTVRIKLDGNVILTLVRTTAQAEPDTWFNWWARVTIDYTSTTGGWVSAIGSWSGALAGGHPMQQTYNPEIWGDDAPVPADSPLIVTGTIAGGAGAASYISCWKLNAAVEQI